MAPTGLSAAASSFGSGLFSSIFVDMKTDLIIIPEGATLLRHEADWSKLLQQLYDRHKLVPRFNPTRYPCWAHKGSTEAADDDISEYTTVHMQYYYLVPRVPRIPGVL